MKVYMAIGLFNNTPTIMLVPNSNPLVTGPIANSVLICGTDTTTNEHIVKLSPSGELI